MRLKTWNKILLAFALILALIAGALGAFYWYELQPKFHDVTVELGTRSIGIEMFLTKYGRQEYAEFVSDVSTLDIGKLGENELTLRQGFFPQTVKLTVVDTTAPEVSFRKEITVRPDYVPDPMDFIESMEDFDGTEVSFTVPVAVPDDGSDVLCTVQVSDPSGNTVSQDCVIHFEWLKPEFAVELGQTLSASDLVYCPEISAKRIEQRQIDAVNEGGVGEYTVQSGEDRCIVTVSDTTPPVLKLKDVQGRLNAAVKTEAFVESAQDLSGDVTLEMTLVPDTATYGRKDVTIRATDAYGNYTEQKAVMAIAQDFNAPSMGGVGSVISIPKHGEADYLEGVYAIDPEEGKVEVTCDSGNVNVDVPGTYFVTYTARDSFFNTTTVKRTVVVEHGQDDTDALVKEIAAGLEKDPEKIRDYVRKTVIYSHDWGGEDPVWFGFKKSIGNCYVHATCLDALLKAKCYNTHLIYTTDKTHYWVLVETEYGTWRHIDATPSAPHNKYSLMTDEERLWTLGGRKWDTTAFPAAN